MGSPKPHGYLVGCLPSGRSETDARRVVALKRIRAAGRRAGHSPALTEEIVESTVVAFETADQLGKLFQAFGAGIK